MGMKTPKDLEQTIDALFQRFPALCGFSVQDVAELSQDRATGQLEGELFVADLSVYPLRVESVRDELLGEIAVALLDLMDERPEAAGLLRGRTFARTLH